MNTVLSTLVRARRVAAMGLFGCLMLAVVPLGCGGVDHAPRLQYLTDGPQLPTITEERVAGCIRTYSNELDSPSYRLQANVRIEENEGRKITVAIQGIPDSAPGFAGCMRITLREMTVPSSMLRTPPTSRFINAPRRAVGNELANPAVLGWAAALLFAELVVEVGGIEVVLAVSLEMVAVAADVLVSSRREKDKCRDEYEKCVDSILWREEGMHIRNSRCNLCRVFCTKNHGNWPSKVPFGDNYGTCEYWAKRLD